MKMEKLNRRTFIKNAALLAATSTVSVPSRAENKQVNLIFRADDMGMSHAANLGCLESYQKGVVRSVEVMVPCPWFPEAAEMLADHKGLDAGLHLTLNSEWKTFRWRPLTYGPSLMDEEGNFYPGFTQPKDKNQLLNGWKLPEVEKELRAQIELGLKKIPHLTHFSDHMFFSREPAIEALLVKLSDEYQLFYENKQAGLAFAPKVEKDIEKNDDQLEAMKARIANLKRGNWIIITHPSAGTEEAHAIRGSKDDIGYKRNLSRQLLINPELVQYCQERVNLVAYKNLI